MQFPLRSPKVAWRPKVPYYRLFRLIRVGQIKPPMRESGGDYVWTEKDVEATRQALETDRRRKEAKGAKSPDSPS